MAIVITATTGPYFVNCQRLIGSQRLRLLAVA
jgi:hypothetical protein